MTHRFVSFFTSTALACAAAGVLAAQSAQGTSPAAQTAGVQSNDARLVTAVGCLKQEKDIPGRLTGLEARTNSGDAFVLTDTRITRAAMPSSPSGSTTPAAQDRAKTLPSGAPGAAGAGTGGTGSTSAQSSDQPASEGARTAQKPGPTGPQTIYRVVGLSDGQLREHLNQQVEIRATLNPASLNPMGQSGADVRQPAATMGREPASTPSASAPPPAPAQAPSPTADQKQVPGPELPSLRASEIRATGGRCQGT